MAAREDGIMSMEGALTERHLIYLLEDTIDAQTKWYYIGLHLDIPPPTLEAIGNDCKTSHEQFIKVLQKWLQGGDTPTMRKMIEALESKLVQEKNLAMQLRSKYENKMTSEQAQAIEIARLQQQLKERENAELRRQLQSAQISPPAQPQKITAAVRRDSKPEAPTNQPGKGDLPTLPLLLDFPLRDRDDEGLNIINQIGCTYKMLGTMLLKDDTGAATEAIEQEFSKKAFDINFQILKRWLQGGGKSPVTWMTLVRVLKQAQLKELARKIENSLL